MLEMRCVQARSLLTAHEDFTTLKFCSGGAALDRPGFVFGFLRRQGLADADVEEVRVVRDFTLLKNDIRSG